MKANLVYNVPEAFILMCAIVIASIGLNVGTHLGDTKENQIEDSLVDYGLEDYKISIVQNSLMDTITTTVISTFGSEDEVESEANGEQLLFLIHITNIKTILLLLFIIIVLFLL